MTVERGWAPADLDGSLVRGGQSILQKTARGAYKAMAALYEVCLDRAPEDCGAQEYAGHEHSDRADNYGGTPIIRNLAFSMDGGAQPLWTYTVTSSWQFLATGAAVASQGEFYISPGMEGRPLKLDLCLKWNPSSGGELEIRHAPLGQPALFQPAIKISPDPDAQWVTMEITGGADQWQGGLNLYGRRLDSGTGDDVEIYAAYMWETYEDTQPPQGASRTSGTTAVSGQGGPSTVERWFGWPDSTLIAADDFISGLTWRQVWAWLAGLYEATTGERSPGASSIDVYGHDHSSGTIPGDGGGLAIPRGCIVSGGTGESNNSVLWTTICGTGAYTSFDTPATNPRTQLFWAYVSPGLTSAAGAAYTSAQLYLVAGTGTANVRVRNLTTATTSTAVVATTTHQWHQIDDVPIQPGWNAFDIEGQGIGASRTVLLYGYVISEIGTDGGANAYPVSQEHSAASEGGL